MTQGTLPLKARKNPHRLVFEEVTVRAGRASPCNYASLLAAVFGSSAEEVLNRWGMTSARRCRRCAKLLTGKPRGQTYCSRPCLYAARRVPIACDRCGRLFEERTAKVVWGRNHPNARTGKPQERYFCSARCRSSYAGLHYGFGILPHPYRKGSHERDQRGQKERYKGRCPGMA